MKAHQDIKLERIENDAMVKQKQICDAMEKERDED